MTWLRARQREIKAYFMAASCQLAPPCKGAFGGCEDCKQMMLAQLAALDEEYRRSKTDHDQTSKKT